MRVLGVGCVDGIWWNGWRTGWRMGREGGGGEGIESGPLGGRGKWSAPLAAGLRFFSRFSPCFSRGKLLPPAHLRVNLSVHGEWAVQYVRFPGGPPPEY